ncbi:DUF86 domain-containing protein [Pseudalkalibacillus hwajinpoensis]|uniref:DUF86 domain-containing protein n=1 Tax=Guptibacillus hwajinpoensis TaxID=208199 RepID=UPI001CD5C2DA|nr:DUF86 domain-containing protein [Pseudalkalibacillus hwajinpoensis]MCA0991852.1 DUF86 domain-containing protein [Pseudalkalibacillus hwajinpoensis]
MYFVDRKKIEEQLIYFDKMIRILKESSFETELQMLGLERLHHVFIESMIDVGNSMIDGFIMRDPGSYEDIIEILSDEKVISSENAVRLKEVVGMRKPLMQEYVNTQHGPLEQNLRKNLSALEQFPADIRKYLTQELGAVSAFLPDNHR